MKKGNRASIRLTFHSRSGTPLSRSTEDLSQGGDVASTDSMDTRSTDSKDKFSESDSSSDKTEPVATSKLAKAAKAAEEKRNQFKLSKLSKLLQESKVPGSNTNLAKSSSPSLKSLQNLTWPKRLQNSPKRKNLPTDWRQATVCRGAPLEPRKEEPRKEEQEKSLQTKSKQKISEMRSTRDKFIIGFKSKSFPNLLKGDSKIDFL